LDKYGFEKGGIHEPVPQEVECRDGVLHNQNKNINFFNETLILNSTVVNLNSSGMYFGESGMLIMGNATIFFG